MKLFCWNAKTREEIMSVTYYVLTIENTTGRWRLNTDTQYMKNIRGGKGDYTPKIEQAFIFDNLASMETAKTFIERDVEFGTFKPREEPGRVEVIPMELRFLLTPLKEENESEDPEGDKTLKHLYMDLDNL